MNRARPNLAKVFAPTALLAAIVMLLQLAGCSLLPNAPKEWSRGIGDISIVATTNVWADLAYQIGGKAVTSRAVIFNVNQDPHSYEASVRDQLMVEKADLLIVNGGGYDDFMLQLTKENNYKNAPVINAVKTAGTRPDGNEHIWFSIERVRKVASEIATKLKAIAMPAAASDIDANLAKVNSKLSVISSRILKLKPLLAGKKAIFAEPVAAYLAEALAVVDATPLAFTKAVEEDSDVSPAAQASVKKLLASGRIGLIIFNPATSGSQAQKVLESASYKIPATEIGELLPQDPDTFEWDGDFFDYLANSLKNFSLMRGVPENWSY